MKYADKCGARYSIVIGTNEAEKKSAVLKNMAEKEQTEVSLDDLSQLINILKEEK
jgi:histidyl-tRNA synthetase